MAETITLFYMLFTKNLDLLNDDRNKYNIFSLNGGLMVIYHGRISKNHLKQIQVINQAFGHCSGRLITNECVSELV